MTHEDVQKPGDYVSISIKENLKRIVPFSRVCSIHRVPERLLDMKRKAYIPKVVAIGPFHRNRHNLKATEGLKVEFFKSYQCRVGLSVEDIVEKARKWEKIARQYYSEPINMSINQFVKMMILDGCFIVEFLIIDWEDFVPKSKNKVRYSSYKAISLDIRRDLIILENQLPFFVLQSLFNLISPKLPKFLDSNELFKLAVLGFLKGCVFPINGGNTLSHYMLNQKPRHLVEFLSFSFVPLNNKNEAASQRYDPPSATQLSDAGVVFKKVEETETCSIMDISFKDGILKIPPIIIDDKFETCARNLLAFAQFSFNENAIHYFKFLDDLISTEKDVNLLEKEGIIINSIGGSQKEISGLFNDICKNITVTTSNCFNDVAKDLKQHCKRRWNMWMASFRHNYLHTPWALISVFAATILIVLTILQTVFTAISTF